MTTTNELSSEFGLSLDQAADLSAQVIDTARAVGLSNEEAAKLSGILQTTSGLSGAHAERLTEGAYQLAAANKVNPSADNKGSSPRFFELSIILSIGPHITGLAVKYSFSGACAAAGLQLHRSPNKITADILNFFIFHFPI